MRFVTKDGKVRRIRDCAHPVWGEEQKRVARIYGAAQAITEKKQMEEVLKESEEKYRTVFENTRTATVIIEEDTTISLANCQFEKLSGYSRKEIGGKKSWTEFVVKKDLERRKGYHRQRRIKPDAAFKKYEFRFIDKKGNVKDIYLTIGMIPGTKKKRGFFT